MRKRHFYKRTMLVVMLIMVFLLNACSGESKETSSSKGTDSGSSQSQEPIRIGWLSSLTGALSSAAIAENKGVQFAVDEINKNGGINGRKIELLVRDTQGDPTKAANYAQQLISSDKADFIIGPVNSGESLATVPIISKKDIPNIIIGTVDTLTDPKKYPDAFRVISTNSQWIEAANNYAINRFHVKKVAVIGDNTGYGTATVDQAEKMLADKGVKVVFKATIDQNQTDVTTDMRKAKEAGAEAVMVWTAATGLEARLLDARSQIGWEVPMIGHPAMAAADVGKLLSDQKHWENAYAVGYKNLSYNSNGNLPEITQKFLDKTKSVLGEKIDYTLWWVALGYDTVQVIKKAVTDAGSTDPDKIRNAIESIKDFKGVYGTYTWSKDNRNGFPTSEVVMNLANSFKKGTYQLAPEK